MIHHKMTYLPVKRLAVLAYDALKPFAHSGRVGQHPEYVFLVYLHL